MVAQVSCSPVRHCWLCAWDRAKTEKLISFRNAGGSSVAAGLKYYPALTSNTRTSRFACAAAIRGTATLGSGKGGPPIATMLQRTGWPTMRDAVQPMEGQRLTVRGMALKHSSRIG